jgi:hypothetical protein
VTPPGGSARLNVVADPPWYDVVQLQDAVVVRFQQPPLPSAGIPARGESRGSRERGRSKAAGER